MHLRAELQNCLGGVLYYGRLVRLGIRLIEHHREIVKAGNRLRWTSRGHQLRRNGQARQQARAKDMKPLLGSRRKRREGCALSVQVLPPRFLPLSFAHLGLLAVRVGVLAMKIVTSPDTAVPRPSNEALKMAKQITLGWVLNLITSCATYRPCIRRTFSPCLLHLLQSATTPVLAARHLPRS